jgi:hypothetical protein
LFLCCQGCSLTSIVKVKVDEFIVPEKKLKIKDLGKYYYKPSTIPTIYLSSSLKVSRHAAQCTHPPVLHVAEQRFL